MHLRRFWFAYLIALIATVSPFLRANAPSLPNDPLIPLKQWHVVNAGQGDSHNFQGFPGIDLGLDKAWQITHGSSNVVVAVIDSGIDLNHPDLKNNIWVNPHPTMGDINGYNFCDKNGNVQDDVYHGTAVAGIIGAEGNNGIGVSGIAWNVKIMAVKYICGDGNGREEDAADAITYAVDHGAKIINASWGTPLNVRKLYKAVQYAQSKGVLFVASAGNDGKNNDTKNKDARVNYPASYDLDNIISVAAVNNKGQLWQNESAESGASNVGADKVHIAAPGADIWTTTLMSCTDCNDPKVPKGYLSFSGTSMAAPMVTGVAALLLSVHPDWDYHLLREAILKYGLPLKSLQGKVQSGAMVNAYAALTGAALPEFSVDTSNWNKRILAVSSPHPYLGDVTRVITQPGAKAIRLHFIHMGLARGDSLSIQNKQGAIVDEIYDVSKVVDGSSSVIAGDTAVIRLYKRGGGGDLGFDVDGMWYSN